MHYLNAPSFFSELAHVPRRRGRGVRPQLVRTDRLWKCRTPMESSAFHPVQPLGALDEFLSQGKPMCQGGR